MAEAGCPPVALTVCCVVPLDACSGCSLCRERPSFSPSPHSFSKTELSQLWAAFQTTPALLSCSRPGGVTSLELPVSLGSSHRVHPGAPLHGSLGCHCMESSVDLPCVSTSLWASNNLRSALPQGLLCALGQLPFIQPQLRARRCVVTVHPVFMSASNHPTEGGVGAPFPRGRVGAQQREFAT